MNVYTPVALTTNHADLEKYATFDRKILVVVLSERKDE